MLIVFDASGISLALAGYNQPVAATQAKDAKVTLPANSPNPGKVYFPDYGQFVANPLLRFWRLNGRFNFFGGPMSRTYVDKEGHTIQFFQKMAIGYFPEMANTQWETRPYHIGRLWLEAQEATVRNAAPFAPVAARPNTKTSKFFPETGHSLNAGFFDLYNKTGGLFIWGFPLSEEYSLSLNGKEYTAQLFERGRMLWTPATGAYVDTNYGTEMAAFLGVNTAVELNPDPLPGQAKIPNYNSWAWEHWVDVNLSSFVLTYYEGDVPVRTNLIVSGKPGWETPTGTFYVLRRVYNERMRGGTIGSEEYYDLSNVLFTQYFTWEGHALHLAWWRSTFGYRGSHGCVNMDYESAEFGWNWLNLGSRIQIHY